MIKKIALPTLICFALFCVLTFLQPAAFAADSYNSAAAALIIDANPTVSLQASVEAALAAEGAGHTKDDITHLTITSGVDTYKLTDNDIIYIMSFAALTHLDVDESVKIDSFYFHVDFFVDNNVIEEVKFPSRNFYGKAFQDCSNLKSINMPNAEIFKRDFCNNCPKLVDVYLPNAKEFGEFSFIDCDILETLKLPRAQKFADRCLQFCNSLKTLSLPSLQTAGSNFLDHSNIQDLELGTPPAIYSFGDVRLSFVKVPQNHYDSFNTEGNGTWNGFTLRQCAVFVFEANGGIAPYTYFYYYIYANGPIYDGADFKREGYTLLSWNTQMDGSGAAYDLGERIVVIKSMTLYAQWEPTPTPTPLPAATPAPTATAAPTPKPTRRPTDAPTFTPTPEPSASPFPAESNTVQDTPVATPTAVPTPIATATPVKDVIIVPADVTPTDGGGAIVTIDIDTLPAGTSAVSLPDGEIIPIDGSSSLQIAVPADWLYGDGSITIIAINDEAVALGSFNVNVTDNIPAHKKVPDWLIALAGLMVLVWGAIFVTRKKTIPVSGSRYRRR